jgi:hypothetical protein
MDIEHLKNIVRDKNIIELQPWQSIHDTITSPMITALGPRDIPGSNLTMGFAYVTKPESLGGPSHQHPFDQYIFLIGGDPNNFLDFDAEIEMTLDGEVKKINYPCYVFIPRGIYHCPLEVKQIKKPLIFIDARLTKEASVRPTASD